LEDKKERMKTPYDPTVPFETLIVQIDDAVDYAVAGRDPFTATTVVNTAYAVIHKTGLYNFFCREWRQQPAADKTWANFKTHLYDTHQELQEDATTT
jgi:hypothetical protein